MADDFIAQISKRIETELVPKLVAEGVLISEPASLKKVDAKPLTITGFALTTPFTVRVELLRSTTNDVKHFNLIVKVKFMNLI